MTIQFCSVETESNFIFCFHSKNEKDRLKMYLVFTDNKEAEGDQIKVHINFCPFCGFSYQPERLNPEDARDGVCDSLNMTNK
jgi:hypothetical protein